MCSNYAPFYTVLSSTVRCVSFWGTHGALDCEANNRSSNLGKLRSHNYMAYIEQYAALSDEC